MTNKASYLNSCYSKNLHLRRRRLLFLCLHSLKNENGFHHDNKTKNWTCICPNWNIVCLCVWVCQAGGGGGGILLNYARKLTFTPVGYKYCLGSIWKNMAFGMKKISYYCEDQWNLQVKVFVGFCDPSERTLYDMASVWSRENIFG